MDVWVGEEVILQAFGKIAVRAVFILCIIVLFFGIAVPKVLGTAPPRSLGRNTWPVHVFRLVDTLPGDTFSETLRIHNYESYPVGYQIVLIKHGDLWRCDPGGNNLYHEAVWSPGADQHLEPGETETVMVTVGLPRATSNTCQGKEGLLTVRQGYLGTNQHGGVYECRPFPFARLSSKGLRDNDDLKGHFCTRAGWPLHTLLNR